MIATFEYRMEERNTQANIYMQNVSWIMNWWHELYDLKRTSYYSSSRVICWWEIGKGRNMLSFLGLGLKVMDLYFVTISDPTDNIIIIMKEIEWTEEQWGYLRLRSGFAYKEIKGPSRNFPNKTTSTICLLNYKAPLTRTHASRRTTS